MMMRMEKEFQLKMAMEMGKKAKMMLKHLRSRKLI